MGAESLDNLARWDPWVRETIVDLELQSCVVFRFDPAGELATLWHIDVAANPSVPANGHQFVAMTRPDPGDFHAQLPAVFLAAGDRGVRTPEILTQMNGALEFFLAIPNATASRTPWTVELLEAAIRFATNMENRFKHALACRRPHEYSALVQPIIDSPSHSTFPSGHASSAFVSALVLWMLLRDSGTDPYGEIAWGQQFMSLAERVSHNRTVAGLHFPVDNAAGQLLGLSLGAYFIARCMGGAITPWAFLGPAYPTSGAYEWELLYDVDGQQQSGQDYATPGSPFEVASNPILNRLWENAKAEWL